MTVGFLKKFIEDIPDETNVLVDGSDHSYEHAAVCVESARFKKGMGFTEDWGPGYESEYGPSQTIILIK